MAPLQGHQASSLYHVRPWIAVRDVRWLSDCTHMLLPCASCPQERQSRQLCLKHTLNNMLQHAAFTQERLEQLADSMTAPTWLGLLSPHR